VAFFIFAEAVALQWALTPGPAPVWVEAIVASALSLSTFLIGLAIVRPWVVAIPAERRRAHLRLTFRPAGAASGHCLDSGGRRLSVRPQDPLLTAPPARAQRDSNDHIVGRRRLVELPDLAWLALVRVALRHV
jgi:hypothetical protein